jgi:predicted alpha/beta-hydrolase family hydrolase
VSVIFLMGHSMGSRLASSFIFKNPDQPVAGLIIAGCRNNGGYPLSCYDNLQDVAIPVLDIWGGDNEKDADAASEREDFLSDKYTQVEVAGANHKFDGYEDEFVLATVNWLKAQNESLNRVVMLKQQ